MGVISKVNAGGSNHLIASSAYGICSTAADTAAKTVNFTDDQAFTLIQGETIHVRFTATNTAANPTLNVKGTGAKPIHRIGGTAAGTSTSNSWVAGEIVSFTYDTTQVSSGCWIMNKGDRYVPQVDSIGSASKGTAINAYTSLTTGDSVTVTTGDSVDVGTAFTVPNVTDVGDAPTLDYLHTAVTYISNPASLYTVFEINADNDSEYADDIENDFVLALPTNTIGNNDTPDITQNYATYINSWDQGNTPTLGTAFTIPNISKKTVVTGVTKKTVVTGGTKTAIPNISVTPKTVVMSISAS